MKRVLFILVVAFPLIFAKLGQPDYESSSGIGYDNYSNSAPILMFLFDSSNKMTTYSIMVRSAYSSVLADFLFERYFYVSEKDGLFMFANGLTLDTITMIIGLSLYNISYWQVIYTTPSPSSESASLKSSKGSIDTNGFDELLKHLQ
jgi:hypothetical protein